MADQITFGQFSPVEYQRNIAPKRSGSSYGRYAPGGVSVIPSTFKDSSYGPYGGHGADIYKNSFLPQNSLPIKSVFNPSTGSYSIPVTGKTTFNPSTGSYGVPVTANQLGNGVATLKTISGSSYGVATETTQDWTNRYTAKINSMSIPADKKQQLLGMLGTVTNDPSKRASIEQMITQLASVTTSPTSFYGVTAPAKSAVPTPAPTPTPSFYR